MQPAAGPYLKLGVSDGMDQPGLGFAEELKRITEAGLFFPPGAAWLYSVGLDVLGAAVQEATGRTLPEVVRERVTAKLGMAGPGRLRLSAAGRRLDVGRGLWPQLVRRPGRQDQLRPDDQHLHRGHERAPVAGPDGRGRRRLTPRLAVGRGAGNSPGRFSGRVSMLRFAAVLTAATLAAGSAAAQAPQPGEAAFRALYKELVETNTTFSAGSCTLAAERMAARLKAAGFADSAITVFTPPGAPKDGGLVAVYPGTDPKAKAILLLAHIDVVEAKREDWTRDPFTLVEEDGYFYGRGASDDKSQAAIWTDLLIRLKQEGFRPRRGIKIALTCGEEGGGQVNGAAWLAQNRRELIDAAFALNEGAGGALDKAGGKPVGHNIQAGEKTSVSF